MFFQQQGSPPIKSGDYCPPQQKANSEKAKPIRNHASTINFVVFIVEASCGRQIEKRHSTNIVSFRIACTHSFEYWHAIFEINFRP
jgi:hypothetical protein